MDAKPRSGHARGRALPPPPRSAALLARKRLAFELGRRSEDVAAAFLTAQGLTILHRNFRRRFGELDLVVRDGDELAIVEVRSRSTEACGGVAASIDSRKIRRVIRAARLFLQQNKALARMRVRFDVVLISYASATPQIQWIRHAFVTN
jgi:putative endonuclease